MQEWSSQQLRLLCETGYIEVLFRIPEGGTLEIDESMREVIVVYSNVLCLPSGVIASSPTIIPHGTTKVALPERTDETTGSRDHARLLVIPRAVAQKSGRHVRGDLPHVSSAYSGGHLNEANKRSQLKRTQTQHLAIRNLLRKSKVHPADSAESGECSTLESGGYIDAVDQ